jgi:hypothetical protein
MPADDRLDVEEYLDILREAVAARNGWKRILARCSPPQGGHSSHFLTFPQFRRRCFFARSCTVLAVRKYVPLDRYGGGLKRTLPFRLPTSPIAEAYDEAGDVEGHFVAWPVTPSVADRPNC